MARPASRQRNQLRFCDGADVRSGYFNVSNSRSINAARGSSDEI